MSLHLKLDLKSVSEDIKFSFTVKEGQCVAFS